MNSCNVETLTIERFSYARQEDSLHQRSESRGGGIRWHEESIEDWPGKSCYRLSGLAITALARHRVARKHYRLGEKHEIEEPTIRQDAINPAHASKPKVQTVFGWFGT